MRHDAVAWGYARGADSRGVDIIQNCEVTGFRIENGECITASKPSRGDIRAKKVGCRRRRINRTRLITRRQCRLPIESHVLQAFVSEALKPVITTVVTFGGGHLYFGQSDKGGLDLRRRYRRLQFLRPARQSAGGRGRDVECGMAIFPTLGRVRLLRIWGGIMDMSMDGSPIIDTARYRRLYLNCGWCYGGFKATPGIGLLLCPSAGQGRTAPDCHRRIAFDRFETGRMIDDKGMGNQPNLH